MINFENKKVLFIDLDSTLIKTISGKTFPEDITDFRIQLPVLDKIKEKFPNLRYFYIVSNQGGIGKFISEADFKTKIGAISDLCFYYLNERKLLMYYDYIYCASNDKTDPNRKPNTGMLEIFQTLIRNVLRILVQIILMLETFQSYEIKTRRILLYT